MKDCMSLSVSSSFLASAWVALITFNVQPVSSDASRTFCPPRPIAWDYDGHDFRRRHGIDHELGLGLIPENDVDTLASQFVGDRLHTGTAHADAGSYRVQPQIVALDCHLGAHAGVTSGPLDFDDAFAHLGHFQPEQGDQELRSSAADEQLRATRLRSHGLKITAQAITGTHGFPGDHLVPGDVGFHIAAQIQVDAAALHPFDHAGDEFAHPALVGVDHLAPFGVAYFLDDHLLGGLGGDAAELDGIDGFLYIIAGLNAGVALSHLGQRDFQFRILDLTVRALIGFDHQPAAKGFVTPGLPVDGDAHVDAVVVPLDGGCAKRVFYGSEDDFFFDVFFIGYNIHHQQDFFVRHGVILISKLQLSNSGDKRAFSMDS
jgi:hypothetical protein